jgi:hypothetical protein
MQLKSNLSVVIFQKVSPPDVTTFNEEVWNYWEFDSYTELYSFVEINLPEQVENVPSEEMM